MADSSILAGNRLPHRGQFCGGWPGFNAPKKIREAKRGDFGRVAHPLAFGISKGAVFDS
jgi:hypothetical protein